MSSLVAIALTATVRVWVPALPPIDATIGISIAKETSFSIAVENSAIDIEAKIAEHDAADAQKVTDKASGKAKLQSGESLTAAETEALFG